MARARPPASSHASGRAWWETGAEGFREAHRSRGGICQVSSRPRRALLGLVAGLAPLVVLPATALAAGETLTVTPTSTQAGGSTNVTAAFHFAAGDTPETVVASLAPGIQGDLNANASCLLGVQLTASCQIGTSTVTTLGGAVAGNLYLVPAATGTADAAGIESVGAPLPNQYIGVTLNPNAPGGLNLTTAFANPGGGNQITDFSVSLTTLNGQEFTRLPSSCSVATSSFTSTYYGGTPAGGGSGSVRPRRPAGVPARSLRPGARVRHTPRL